MEHHVVNLPDFSRGETFPDVGRSPFEPLFSARPQPEEAASTLLDSELGLSELPSTIVGLDDLSDEVAELDPPEEENTILVSEHELIIENLNRHHADAIDELTEKHQQEVMKYLEDVRSQLADDVTSRLEMELAGVLSSLFERKLSEACADKLMQEVRSISRDSVIDRLQISGPPELVSKAMADLSETSFPIEIEESDSADLTVSFNDKRISTNVSHWMKLLEEAIAS